jgi:hypothetical protein
LITQQLTVSFSGPNGGDVIDMYSDPISSVTVSGGVLTFGLRNQVTPTVEQPARITLNITGNGIEPFSRTVNVFSEGQNTARARLLRPSNPPAGMAIQQTAAGTADASGAIAQPIEITAPVTGQNEPSEATQISVAQGSVLRDANGVALQGGITAVTRTLNPNEPAAMGTVNLSAFESLLPEGNVWQIESSTSVVFRDASGRTAATVTGSQQSKEMGSVANVECEVEVSTTPNNTLGLNVTIPPPEYRIEGDESLFAILGPAQGNPFITQVWWGIPKSTIASLDPLAQLIITSNCPGTTTLVSGTRSCTVNNLTVDRNGHVGLIEGTVSAEGFSRDFTIPAGSSRIQFQDDNYNFGEGQKYTIEFNLPDGTRHKAEDIDMCSQTTPIALPAPQGITSNVRVNLSCENGNPIKVQGGIPLTSFTYRLKGEVGVAPRTGSVLNWIQSATELTGVNVRMEGVIQNSVYTITATVDNASQGNEDITILGPNFDYDYKIKHSICD